MRRDKNPLDKCPECGEEVGLLNECPLCGHELAEERERLRDKLGFAEIMEAAEKGGNRGR